MEATGSVLGMFDPAVSTYATSVLEGNGASILCNAMVTCVKEGAIEYKTKKKGSDKGSEKVHSMEYGTVVWAGGINTRPITTHITTELNKLHPLGLDGRVQQSPRGIEVDDKFRVKGLEKESNVFAIGDCAIVKGCAPTAQAAYQQGKYLGRLLRDTHTDTTLPHPSSSYSPSPTLDMTTSRINLYNQFQFHNYGALAYVGTSKGVAELKTVLWSNPLEILKSRNKDDNKTENKPTSSTTVVEGGSAFVIWRSLYFSKLLSQRNKAQVGFDWMKTGVFGRDISSPYDIPSIKK
jgi:NADH dehydrogenase FAD-containing subunit